MFAQPKMYDHPGPLAALVGKTIRSVKGGYYAEDAYTRDFAVLTTDDGQDFVVMALNRRVNNRFAVSLAGVMMAAGEDPMIRVRWGG